MARVAHRLPAFSSGRTIAALLTALLTATAQPALLRGGDAVAQVPVQLSRATYERAEAVDRPEAFRKVTNELVVPHWIGMGDAFWYRRETPAGHDFVRVDAATGKAGPLFDQSRLATALTRAAGAAVLAAALPIDSVWFAGARSFARAIIGSEVFECDLARTECHDSVEPPAPEALLLSPDDRWGLGAAGGNLRLRDLATGVVTSLTEDGEPAFGYGVYPDGWKADFVGRERRLAAGDRLPPMAAYWSPDSRRVIVPLVDQRHVQPYPFLETVPAGGGLRPIVHSVRIPLVGERPPTLEWFVFDIPTGLRRRLEFPYPKLLVFQQDMLAIRNTWFSSDGGHLYAVAFGDNMESAFFFDADLATGMVRTVIEEHLLPRADLNTTSYNPPNVRLVNQGREVIWFSQRDGWGHLYRYDLSTGSLRNRITDGDWLVRDIVHVDEARGRVYFTGSGREPGNPYYRYLYRAGLDGSELTLLSPEPADHMVTSPWNDVLAIDGAVGYPVVSPSGEFIVYNHSTPSRPTETVIRATADGRLIATFERADASALVAAGYRAPEEFTAKAADGSTDLYGVMYRPSGFDPARRYPVLDVEYASPLTAVVPRNFLMAITGPSSPSAPAAYAELGLVAVVVDGRGTTNRSRAFSQANFGKLNTFGLDELVAAIRELGRRHSFLDLDRVGVIGRSYGGWSAFRAMLEFPEFYQVGVSGAPPGSMHNMYLDYHWTAFHGRPEYSDGSDRRPGPTDVSANYVAVDGRHQAERLQGKLLVIMGELDENVLPGSTLQFLDALQRANKDFDLIYLANQNHYFTGNPYVTRRVWDYLARNLLGAEPPRYRVGGVVP